MMDDETRETIEALIRRKEPPRRTKMSYEHVRAPRFGSVHDPPEYPEPKRSMFTVEEPIEPPKPKPAPNFGVKVWSVKDEVAVLSVNTSKACVVLRADITDAVESELKRIAPGNKCVWNSKEGVFEINPSVLSALRSLLKVHYRDVQVFGIQKQVQATKFDQLLARLDRQDKDKIYKILAMRYHPDKGGDKETMTLINLVFKGG